MNEVSPPQPEEKPEAASIRMGRDETAKGFAWTAGFNLVAKMVFPLAGLFVSRRLGPEILGIFALLQYTLQISEVFRDAGIAQSYLGEVDVDAEKDATYAGLALIMGIIPAVVVLLLTPFLARFFEQPELNWALPVVSLVLVMNGLSTTPNIRMLRRGDLKAQAAIGLAASATGLATTITLVALGVGFPALVAQLAVGGGMGLFLVLRREPLGGIRVGRSAVSELFRRTRLLLGANLVNNLFLLSDIFVMKKLVGITETGLYNVAQNIAYKPAELISFPLSKTLMVAFGQAAGDPERVARAYYRSLAAIVLFVLPIYLFLGLGSETVIRTLLGEGFAGAIPVLSALCVYLAFRTLGNIAGNALVPVGRHAWTFYPWIGAVVFTAVGVAWVSRAPSLMGVVWVYVIGAVLVYGSILLLSLRFIPGDHKLYRDVGRAATVSASTSAVFLIVFNLPIPHWIAFLLAAFLGLLAHILMLGTLYNIGTLKVMSRNGMREVWRKL